MISRKRLLAALGVKIVSSAGRVSELAVPVGSMPLPNKTLNTPSEMVAVCSSVHKRVPPVEASKMRKITLRLVGAATGAAAVPVAPIGSPVASATLPW